MESNNYGKVTVGPTTGLDYMDAYHCEQIDSTSYELVCSAYQPDWYVEVFTEGYPRFGVDESELSAIIINASSTDAAEVYDVFLAGAATLVTSVVTLVLAFSF